MNPGLFLMHQKYPLGANDFTHAAAHTCVIVQSQSGHAGKISKSFHSQIPIPGRPISRLEKNGDPGLSGDQTVIKPQRLQRKQRMIFEKCLFKNLCELRALCGVKNSVNKKNPKTKLNDYPANADPTQAATASDRAATWSGIALRISFSTPDGEVKGVDPVKFIAR